MLKTKDGYAKVIGTSYQGSSDYLLLSNGDSKAISSLSVSYADNADKLDGEHASAFSYKSWWHWSGQSGQPSWIWGGNSENNYYVYNPSNFRVNYAKSAGSVAWDNVTGRPSTFAPSAHTHKWADITDHITKLSQLTNDKGFVTGSVSGKTITINGSSTTWSDTWRPITDDYELGESGTSLSSLGALTLYTDLLGSIPNPTDYYWANNKITSTSKTDAEVRVKNLGAGCSTTIENTIMATNWLRAKGSTGIYFQDHGGGLYMSDDTWIRTWAGKALQVDNTIRSTDFHTTYYANNVWTITSAARLENSTTLIYGFSTSSNNINTYLRGTNITLQVKKDTSINYNAFQVTADRIYCNNYCDMKNGAAVSGGNLTVQNNAYLAQKAGTKVGIGTNILQCTLNVKGSEDAPIRVNGSIELSLKEVDPYLDNSTVYFTQPVCIAVGKYISQEKRIKCSNGSSALIINNRIFKMSFEGKLLEKTSDMWVFPIIHTDTDSKYDYTCSTNEYDEFQLGIRWYTDIPDFTFMIYRFPFEMRQYTVEEH